MGPGQSSGHRPPATGQRSAAQARPAAQALHLVKALPGRTCADVNVQTSARSSFQASRSGLQLVTVPATSHQPSVSRSKRRPHGLAKTARIDVGKVPAAQAMPPVSGHRPAAPGEGFMVPPAQAMPSASAQVLPSAIGHRSAGQTLHLVKVPAIGQPLQAKASRCQQLRSCHRPAVSRPAGQPPCLRHQLRPCHRPAVKPCIW